MIIDVVFEQTFELDIGLELGTILGDDMLPTWEGPYEIKPKVNEQNFQTKNKKMEDDLTVLEIPYTEVTNPSGGKTIMIE